MIRRREFIAGWSAGPLAARAHHGYVRRIGVLMSLDENDPEGKLRYSAFTQALADLGWTDGGGCGWSFGGSAPTSIGYQCLRRSWWACNPTS
jgi:hypothetical protein